jgi:hypothetical protein
LNYINLTVVGQHVAGEAIEAEHLITQNVTFPTMLAFHTLDLDKYDPLGHTYLLHVVKIVES